MEKKGTNPNLKSFLSHMALSGQFFSNLTWFWTLWHLSQTPAMCADSKSILTLCAYRPQSYIYIYIIIVEQLRSCKVLSDKLGISPVETDIMCFVQSALLLLQVLERPAGLPEADRLRQWITKTCGIKTGPSTSVTWDSDWRAAELSPDSVRRRQHWISVSIFAQEEASPPKPLPCQSTCQNGRIFF